MQKKSLGRGLDEISNIFLSEGRGEKRKAGPLGFSSVSIREETCAACVNIIGYPSEEPRCRIFSLENEKYGVPHIDIISLRYGNYCEHFQPRASDALLEDVNLAKEPGDAEASCEIEETITLRRKMAYPDTEAAQEQMRKELFRHLEEGYIIRTIELRRTRELSNPEKKQTKIEGITIFSKEE
jgi:hypothetical protein